MFLTTKYLLALCAALVNVCIIEAQGPTGPGAGFGSTPTVGGISSMLLVLIGILTHFRRRNL